MKGVSKEYILRFDLGIIFVVITAFAMMPLMSSRLRAVGYLAIFFVGMGYLLVMDSMSKQCGWNSFIISSNIGRGELAESKVISALAMVAICTLFSVALTILFNIGEPDLWSMMRALPFIGFSAIAVTAAGRLAISIDWRCTLVLAAFIIPLLTFALGLVEYLDSALMTPMTAGAIGAAVLLSVIELKWGMSCDI